MTVKSSIDEILDELAGDDGPVAQTLSQMHRDTFERSGLDERTYLLVRFATLVALGASPVSYLVNLALLDEAGIGDQEMQGVLAAIAPVVGSARLVSAASGVNEALRMARA
jgi:alkylhydroperoxidase/carboxymuconolactone decarboxylase family protein YurZ